MWLGSLLLPLLLILFLPFFGVMRDGHGWWLKGIHVSKHYKKISLIFTFLYVVICEIIGILACTFKMDTHVLYETPQLSLNISRLYFCQIVDEILDEHLFISLPFFCIIWKSLHIVSCSFFVLHFFFCFVLSSWFRLFIVHVL